MMRGTCKLLIGKMVLGWFFVWLAPVPAQSNQQAGVISPVLHGSGRVAAAPCLCLQEDLQRHESPSARPGLESRRGRWKVRAQRKIENSTCRNFTVGPTCSRGGDGCEFEVIGGMYFCQ